MVNIKNSILKWNDKTIPQSLFILALISTAGCVNIAGKDYMATRLDGDGQIIELEGDPYIDIHLPPSTVKIESTDEDNMSVAIISICNKDIEKCRAQMQGLGLESTFEDGKYRIKPRKTSFAFVTGITYLLKIPESRHLDINMVTGDITVDSVITGNLNIELDIGRIEVNLRSENYRGLNMSTRVGNITLLEKGKLNPGARSGFLGSKVSRELGDDGTDINLANGIGDIVLSLN